MRRWVWNNFELVSLVAMVAILSFTLVKVVHLSRDGKQAHDAICALKGDLSQRIDSSTGFLKTHPAGIPGIPARLIRDGIRNQQRTLVALHSVKCSSEERQPTGG